MSDVRAVGQRCGVAVDFVVGDIGNEVGSWIGDCWIGDSWSGGVGCQIMLKRRMGPVYIGSWALRIVLWEGEQW